MPRHVTDGKMLDDYDPPNKFTPSTCDRAISRYPQVSIRKACQHVHRGCGLRAIDLNHRPVRIGHDLQELASMRVASPEPAIGADEASRVGHDDALRPGERENLGARLHDRCGHGRAADHGRASRGSRCLHPCHRGRQRGYRNTYGRRRQRNPGRQRRARQSSYPASFSTQYFA